MPGIRSETLSLDDADAAYEVLAEHVERFIAAWETGGQAPGMAEFLPAGPAALRRLGLIELVKVDLDYRHQRNCAKPLDDYFVEFPELLAGSAAPLDLVYEEFHILKQCGVTVDIRPYFQRFPKHKAKIEQMLGLPYDYRTTRVVGKSGDVQVEPGSQLDDFDLIKELGAGAFAKVFLARQRSMQRFVALKISADQSDEPQTLAQLDHPHIVRVFDQRIIPERRMRLLYMQYVPGGTLQDVIKAAHALPAAQRSGKTVLAVIDEALERRGELLPSESFARRALNDLTWAEAICRIVASLASALDYAHGRGVLHRDVKPANVLLAAEGSPKLADFNISFSSQVEGASPREFFGGSLAYMSPEQLEAYDPNHPRQPEDIDGRSDLYGLGVILWEMLTGRRPFEDQMLPQGIEATIREMRERRRRGVPDAAIRTLPADCPGVKEVLLKCLAPDEHQRFADAGQLASALELCLDADVQDLFYPPPDAWRTEVARWPLASWFLAITPESWRRTAAAWPLIAMLTAALLPNIVLSALNIFYNLNAMIKRLPGEGLMAFFQNVQVSIVNLVAYGLGIGAIVWLFWPIRSALQRVRDGGTLDGDSWRFVVRRCLRIGLFAGGISLALWIVTSPVFLFWLQMTHGDAKISGYDYAHFVISQLFCGLIAASLTYFFLTCVALRAFCPRLLPSEARDEDMARDLSRAGRPVTKIFLTLAIVPILSFMVFVPLFQMRPKDMSDASSPAADDALAVSFVVLGIIGILGIWACLYLGRRIQWDLAALRVAVSPGPRGESAHVATETPSALLGSTRLSGSTRRRPEG